jgi:hypothetical protein
MLWLIGAILASIVASTAAAIAVFNTVRLVRQAEKQESHRRRRKHTAVRAVLPLALAQVSHYTERSVRALDEPVGRCNGEILPAQAAPSNLIQPLPSETLETLSDFVEYADAPLNVRICEDTNDDYEALVTDREQRWEGGAFGRLRENGRQGTPMTEHEFRFVSSILDDYRKLIAAGNIQRWAVVKWAVTVNVALATASIALKQQNYKSGWLFLALAIFVAVIALGLTLEHNRRMTNARSGARKLLDREWRQRIGYCGAASHDCRPLVRLARATDPLWHLGLVYWSSLVRLSTMSSRSSVHGPPETQTPPERAASTILMIRRLSRRNRL